MNWTIDFYKTKNGKVPVREFLDSLNPRQAANVIEAMDDLEKYLNERIVKDKEFKKIWEEETIKRDVIKMIIQMRIKEGLTQKDLAERLKTSQSSIARLESGNGNPTLNFLVKLGKVFDKKIELRYV